MANVFCAQPNGLQLKLYASITVDDTAGGHADMPADIRARKIAIATSVQSLVAGNNVVPDSFWNSWKSANPGSSLLGSVLFG